MNIVPRFLLALPLAALLIGSSPAPAAAQFSSLPFVIYCNFCALPDTWVWTTTDGTAEYPALFTFDDEGTVIADDQWPWTMHGTWARIGPFTYSVTLLRVKSDSGFDFTGWDRIRIKMGYDGTCNRLKGDLWVDHLEPGQGDPLGIPENPNWTPKPPEPFTISAYRLFKPHPLPQSLP